MWSQQRNTTERNARFFLIGLSHETLENYYRTNFLLNRHHKYTLTELDNMMPWEREVHMILLLQALEEEKKQREETARNKQ